MKKTSLKLAGAVLASFLASLAARASLTINENVSLSGYAAGSIAYEKSSGQNTETSLKLDAVKLQLDLAFEPLTSTVSLYTAKDPYTGDEKVYLLDAAVSYDLGKNFSLTGGRFLTWIGYEAFDIPETNFITWGVSNVFDNTFFVIPDYHEGVKIEYTHGKSEFGLAVLDSIYGVDYQYLRGDGGVRDGMGFEAHYGYTETNWSMGANLGYQYSKEGFKTYVDDEGVSHDPYVGNPKLFIANIWAEWNIGDTTLAAELFYKHERARDIDNANLCYAMLMAKQQVTGKITSAARLTYGNRSDFGNFWKLSVAPVEYEFTNMFSIRSEISYTRYSKGVRDFDNPKSDVIAAVQAVFKF